MNLTCAKCGEILLDGREHATPADCHAAMKELVRRIRQLFSEGSLTIAKCRAAKHGGKKVLYPLNVCVRCLGAGYSAYQIGHELVTSGRIPKPVLVKP
jgi:hypothetical protein